MLRSSTLRRDGMHMAMAETIEQWCVAQGLLGTGVIEIMRGFCARAVADGLPLARGVIALSTLHPKYGAMTCRWVRAVDGVEIDRIAHEEAGSGAFLRSPFAYLLERR